MFRSGRGFNFSIWSGEVSLWRLAERGVGGGGCGEAEWGRKFTVRVCGGGGGGFLGRQSEEGSAQYRLAVVVVVVVLGRSRLGKEVQRASESVVGLGEAYWEGNRVFLLLLFFCFLYIG